MSRFRAAAPQIHLISIDFHFHFASFHCIKPVRSYHKLITSLEASGSMHVRAAVRGWSVWRSVWGLGARRQPGPWQMPEACAGKLECER